MNSDSVSFVSNSINDLEGIASELLKHAGNQRIFLLEGKMGAGKTTFIKALCKVLGVKESVTSPTFSLVNEYTDSKGDPVFHFDFYRIENSSEALDIGVEEYFDSGNTCFIEWPDKISGLIPVNALRIHISESGGKRTIVLNLKI